VSCYIDDPSDNNEIGDIEVFNVNVAAQECNGAFEDCVGDCTGCYLDSESLEMCIDSSGDRFERE
jgi:hypothetical protein